MGGGVLHTKLWVVDRTHVYVGSANMDWRSLSQVKELGLVAMNCSCLAKDYAKIFDVSDNNNLKRINYNDICNMYPEIVTIRYFLQTI